MDTNRKKGKKEKTLSRLPLKGEKGVEGKGVCEAWKLAVSHQASRGEGQL